MGRTSCPRSLLVLDDDRVFCEAVKDGLASEKLEVTVAHTMADGLAICKRNRVDVVLLDQNLPDGRGQDLCPQILDHNEQAKIIFITAYPSFDHAVEAVRAGAHDYLSKPFDLGELKLAVVNSLRTVELERVEQLEAYRTRKDRERTVLVGDAGGLTEIQHMIDLASSTNASVLITGETGTGKNVVARSIHHRGPNCDAPFVSINCASLPENLMETELFGYEKGAFTGATTAHKGIFEMAEGGTLFLDEIGEMPLNLQSKLLGVLEDKTIRRIGGESIRPVQVRIIAATNSELDHLGGNPGLREDLYYRLSVIRIHVPPLRERQEDIPKLCDFFLGKAVETHLDAFKEIKGYLASSIMGFSGTILVSHSKTDSIDMEAVGAVFNDIFRSAHEAAGEIGLEACTDTVITTPKGVIVMKCSGVKSAAHIHFIVILEAGGNQSLVRVQLQKAVPAAVMAVGRKVWLPSQELDRLKQYRWPGNVRELRNVLERSVLLQGEGPLKPSKFLLLNSGNGTAPTNGRIPTLEEVEKQHILAAFKRLEGNYTRTAHALGLSLSTLKRKIKSFNHAVHSN